MPENQALDYDDVADALDAAATTAGAADCHGLLTGLVCANGVADPKAWVGEIFEAYNPTDKAQADAFRLLQQLYQQTLAQLNSTDISFELLLPDDGCPLRERAEALGHWCAGFLSGLGIGGMPGDDKLPEDIRELLGDLSQISRVDFDVDEPDEQELVAFEEVVEYIRVGVMFMHDELQPAAEPPSQVQ